MSLRGGIDLGGTKIQAVVVDEDFQVLGDARVPTPTAGGPQDVADAMAAAMREAADGHGDPVAIGVGSPGVIDEAAGVVSSARNLPGWEGSFPLAGALQHALGAPVAIGNDVNVATDAEFELGAAREFASLLGVFWGTGVGGGHHARLQAVDGPRRGRRRSATSSSRSAARAARAAGAAAWRPTPAAARWSCARASSSTRAARPCCSRSWRSAAARG